MKNFLCFENGILHYIPEFFPNKEANEFFDYLLNQILWKRKKIFVYGRWVFQPRKIFWNGDVSYTYSRLELPPIPWDPIVKKIKNRIEETFNLKFNHALLNLYTNENDYISWHSDDEKELKENPQIASFSLGVKRKILFCKKKEKKNKKNILSLELEHNSLFLMLGSIQHFWIHSVPKERKIEPFYLETENKCYYSTSRINITFRKIYK